MKEIGILMTLENRIATIDGRKTMTRRVIKPQPPQGYIYKGDDGGNPYLPKDSGHYWMNGYAMWRPRIKYAVGDRLYLKEPHYRFGRWYENGVTKTGKQRWSFSSSDFFGTRYSDNPPDFVKPAVYTGPGWYKRSPLFMPKKYARHWYEITEVRAERVQDISEEDAIKEGVQPYYEFAEGGAKWSPKGNWAYRDEFKNLWDSINAKRGYSWKFNPWVWPIEYKELE